MPFLTLMETNILRYKSEFLKQQTVKFYYISPTLFQYVQEVPHRYFARYGHFVIPISKSTDKQNLIGRRGGGGWGEGRGWK